MSAALALNTLIDTRTGKAIDLAMQKLEVTGRVYPLGSFVRVTHRFKCLGTQPMEAIYVSALPTGGTLRRFKVVGENFEVDSKLEKRKKARQEYETGLSEGHLSVLAETNQDGLVHLSVGQVQPDEEISVIMDVIVGVTTRDKGFQFRYPFTLAPSYHSQAKMSSTGGGGGRIELPEDVFGDLTLPEWKTAAFGLHEVSFNLTVFGGTNLMAVSSPSHRITVAPQKDGSSRVSLAGMGDTPNRDLVIDVSVPEAAPVLYADATLLGETATGKEPQVPQGAGRWTAFIPSTLFNKAARQPRKVCFVIDRSGSMQGQPIEQAKQALLACLSTLQSDDEFGIVHFGSDATHFHHTLGKADDATRKKAQAWVERIGCDGGTEMLGALAAATRVLGGPGDIFILTDGEVYQTGPIIEHMAASKSRVHVLGIGTASQHRFMAQLARRTGGVCDMVSPQGDVGMAGLKLFNQVKDPILLNASATVDGTDVAGLGTLWDGLPLLVTDPKGDGSLPGAVLVSGTGVSDMPVTGFVQVKVPDGLTALLWAGRKIEDLSSKMDMTSAGPKRDLIEQRMEDLSVGYSLASRVMSLVAVVERIGDQAGVTPEQKVVAVGVPEGMEPVFDAYVPKGVNFAQQNSNPLRLRRMTKGVQLASVSMAADPYASLGPNWMNPTRSADTFSLCSDSGDDARSRSIPDACYESTTRGGLFLHDHQNSVSLDANVVACAAGPAPTYDPDFWLFTGNLLRDLAELKADGGVPGHTLENRVWHTIVLALIVSLEANQFPGVYDQHIVRMAAFIESHKDLMKEPVVMHKVLKVLKGGATCGIHRDDLAKLFARVNQTEVMDILRQGL